MRQEDKTLLLQDLSARLPYGVMIEGLEHPEVMTIKHLAIISVMIAESYKPFLRSMSSMTEDEKEWYYLYGISCTTCASACAELVIDWLNKKMFDYRGLIEKGLALEAPKDMYK